MPAPSYQDYIRDARQYSENDHFTDAELINFWKEDFGQQYLAENTGDFEAGLIQGTDSLSSMGNYTVAAGADLLGLDEIRDNRVKAAQAAEEDAALYSQNRPTRIEDIEGVGSGVDWLQYQLGAAIPTLLESILGGVVGAAVSGGANPVGFVAGAAGKSAVKQVVKNLVAGGLKKEAAERLAKESVERYIKDKTKDKVRNKTLDAAIAGGARAAGAERGVLATGYQMGVGDLYGTSVEAGDPSALAAFGEAIPYALADMYAAKLITGPLMKGVARNGSRLGTAVKTGAATGLGEGSAEATQEELNIQLQAYLDPEYDPNGEEAWSRRINSAVVGGLLGGALGAPTGGMAKSDQTLKAEYIDRAITEEAKANVENGIVKSLDELEADLKARSEAKKVMDEHNAQEKIFQEESLANVRMQQKIAENLKQARLNRDKKEMEGKRRLVQAEVRNKRQNLVENTNFLPYSGEFTVENDTAPQVGDVPQISQDYRKTNGNLFKTEKEAMTAARSGKRFKGMSLAPVAVDGGFVLRQVRDVAQKRLPNLPAAENETINVSPQGTAFNETMAREEVQRRRDLGMTGKQFQTPLQDSVTDIVAELKQGEVKPAPTPDVNLEREAVTNENYERTQDALREEIDSLPQEDKDLIISELRKNNKALQDRLYTSPITGTANRLKYQDTPKKKFTASIDVDSLKWVNDNLGHEAGDKLLHLIGQSLRDKFGAEFFHVSGDEFIGQADDENVLLNAIRDAYDELEQEYNYRKLTFDLDGETVKLTKPGFSFGIGTDIASAEKEMMKDKQYREFHDERAPRGEEPPGVRRQRTKAKSKVDSEAPEHVNNQGRPFDPDRKWSPMYDMDSEPVEGAISEGIVPLEMDEASFKQVTDSFKELFRAPDEKIRTEIAAKKSEIRKAPKPKQVDENTWEIKPSKETLAELKKYKWKSPEGTESTPAVRIKKVGKMYEVVANFAGRYDTDMIRNGELMAGETRTERDMRVFPQKAKTLETAIKRARGMWLELETEILVHDHWVDEAINQREGKMTDGSPRPDYLGDNSNKVILSFFDLTGSWAEPWADAGYNVIPFDIQDHMTEQDIMELTPEKLYDYYGIEGEIYGILAACPCTDFTNATSKDWAAKKADGRVEASKDLVFQTLDLIEQLRPEIWVIENPVGKIADWTGLPQPRATFQPWHFGHAYTKQTNLWGKFQGEMPVSPVDPVMGSMMHDSAGGNSLKTKNFRSETPRGFAQAFFRANNYLDLPVETRLVQDFPELSGAIKKALDAGMNEGEIREIVEDDYDKWNMEESHAQGLRDALAKEVVARTTQGPTLAEENQKPAVQQGTPKAKKSPATAVNTAKDSLTTVVAKLGGISLDEAVANGIDPADAKNFSYGIRRTYHNGKSSNTLDGMRENLTQYGYQFDTVNDLLDALDTDMRGEPVRADSQSDDDMAAQYESYMESKYGPNETEYDYEYAEELENVAEYEQELEDTNDSGREVPGEGLQEPTEAEVRGQDQSGTDETDRRAGKKTVVNLDDFGDADSYNYTEDHYNDDIPFSDGDFQSVDGDDIPFSRAADQKSVVISPEKLDAVVERIRARTEGARNIEVVGTFSDLPSAVQKEAHKQNSDGSDIEGTLHNGKIYLVADRVKNEAHAEEIIFHEATHAGLRQMLSDRDVVVALNQLWAAIGGSKGLLNIAEELGVLDRLKPYLKDITGQNYKIEVRNAILVDELVAFSGQVKNKSIKARFNELLGAIRAWLRKKGFAKLAEYNAADIAHLAKSARNIGMKQNSGVKPVLLTTDNNRPSLRKITDAKGSVYSRLAEDDGNKITIDVELNKLSATERQEAQLYLDTDGKQGKANASIQDIIRWAERIETDQRRREQDTVDMSRRKFLRASVAVAATAVSVAAGVNIDTTSHVTFGKAKPFSATVVGAKVSPEIEKVARLKNANAQDLLKAIAKNGPQELRDLATKLTALVPQSVRIQVNDKSQIAAHGKTDFQNGRPFIDLYTAKYRDDNGNMVNRQGLTYETILHEATHAAVMARYHTISMGSYDSNFELVGSSKPESANQTKEFIKIWNEFKFMVNSEGGKQSGAIEEAMRTPDEFFVRALTEPELQSYLSGREYRGTTLYERFKDWVKYSLFGFKREGTIPSWLDAALMSADDVLETLKKDEGNFEFTKAVEQFHKAQHSAILDSSDIRFSRAATATGTTSSLPGINPNWKAELKRRKSKFLTKAERFIERNFIRWGLTNKETHDLKLKADAQKNLGESELSYMLTEVRGKLAKAYGVKDYNDIPADEVAQINLALTGADVTLSADVAEAVTEMRDHLDLWSTNMEEAIKEQFELKVQSLSKSQLKQLQDAEAGIAPLPAGHPLAGMLHLLQVIDDNKGQYLNRSYQAFDDTEWKDKVMANNALVERGKAFFRQQNLEAAAARAIGYKAAQNEAKLEAAIRYLEDFVSSDLLTPANYDRLELMHDTLLTDEQLTGKVSELLQAAREKGEIASLIANGQLYGSKDVSILKRRKNVPPVIRELLGEYKDPLVNFTRSATKMQWYVANHKFLMELRKTGLDIGFLKEKPEVDAKGDKYDSKIANESTDTMNPLGGLYSTADFKVGMADMLDRYEASGFLRKFIAFNGMVKYGKVVLSPTTQARNFMSASMFLLHMGHNPFSIKHLKQAGGAAWSDLFNKDQDYKNYINHLIELNVLHDNAYAGELRDTLRDFIKHDEPVLADTRGVTGKLKQANNFFQKSYRLGDDFWKIIAFEQEKQMWLDDGKSQAEAERIAADRVRNSIPTYSMIPRAMRGLRRFPLMGAFVAFPYEILRTSVNTMKFIKEDMQAGRTKMATRRIAGLLMAHSAYGMAAAASMAAMGISDEDDEVIRMLGPEYARNSYNLYFGRDEDGNLQYIDTTFLDPYNLLQRPLRAITTSTNETMKAKLKDAVMEFGSPFLSPDIVAGTLSEALFNQKRNGGQVYNEQDTWDEQTKDVLGHIATGLAPGVWGNIERNVKAQLGIRSPSGREYDPLGEAIAIVGFRNTTLDAVQSLRYNGYRFKDALNDAQRVLSVEASNRNPVSRNELREAFRDSMSAREHTYRNIVKIIKQLRRLDYNDAEISSALSASRFSKADIGTLLKGKIPEWQMSRQFLDSAIKGVSASSLKSKDKMEARRMLNDRKAQINKLAQEYYAGR